MLCRALLQPTLERTVAAACLDQIPDRLPDDLRHRLGLDSSHRLELFRQLGVEPEEQVLCFGHVDIVISQRRRCQAGRHASAGALLREQLVPQNRRHPALVALAVPSSIQDEQAVDLGGCQRVDDVGRVAFA